MRVRLVALKIRPDRGYHILAFPREEVPHLTEGIRAVQGPGCKAHGAEPEEAAPGQQVGNSG